MRSVFWALAALGCLAAYPASSRTVTEISGRASVIDGDTIEIHGKRIRLFGIDAPEGRQVCTRDGAPYRCGTTAARALDDLIAERPVSCAGDVHDRYRRLVARCLVGGVDINEVMVRQGLALAYRHYSLDYVAAEDAARAAKRGLWSGEFEAPWDWRRARH